MTPGEARDSMDDDDCTPKRVMVQSEPGGKTEPNYRRDCIQNPKGERCRHSILGCTIFARRLEVKRRAERAGLVVALAQDQAVDVRGLLRGAGQGLGALTEDAELILR